MKQIRQLGSAGVSAALALFSAVSGLRAQAPSRETVQLAFGYECEDRFLIRNDGGQTVTLQYGVQGNPERATLTLTTKQQVEVSSASGNPVELWVSGKLAATERKGSRPCAAPAAAAIPDTPDVVVRPIDQPDYPSQADAQSRSSSSVVVVAPPPYGYYDYYGYDPYYSYGYPYRRAAISVVVPFVGFGWSSRSHVTHFVPARPPRGRAVVVHPRSRR